jgi:hypothetical protein
MMQRALGLGFVLGLTAAPALAQVQPLPASAEWTLAPGAFEELCFELDAGRTVRYQFDAGAPLEFNLHWHRGNNVLFPVRSGAVQRRAGTFTAERKEGYCLMWTNRTKKPATLRARADPLDEGARS